MTKRITQLLDADRRERTCLSRMSTARYLLARTSCQLCGAIIRPGERTIGSRMHAEHFEEVFIVDEGLAGLLALHLDRRGV